LTPRKEAKEGGERLSPPKVGGRLFFSRFGEVLPSPREGGFRGGELRIQGKLFPPDRGARKALRNGFPVREFLTLGRLLIPFFSWRITLCLFESFSLLYRCVVREFFFPKVEMTASPSDSFESPYSRAERRTLFSLESPFTKGISEKS